MSSNQNSEQSGKKKLNPNAPSFSFNPNATSFSPSFGSSSTPAPSALASASVSASKLKLNPSAPAFNPVIAASTATPMTTSASFTASSASTKPHSTNEEKSSPITPQNSAPSSSSSSSQHQKEESKEQVSSPSNGSVKEIAEPQTTQEESHPFFEPVSKNGRKTYARDVLEEIRKLVSSDDTVEISIRDISVHQMPSSSSSRYDNKPHQRRYNDKDAPTRDQWGSAAMKDQRRNNQGRNNQRQQKDAPMDIEIKPLVESENRYRILKDIPSDVKVVRGVTSILNKLTPEKFDVLVQRILELEITSEALLRDVVSTVFEKAINEPNYSPTYADFCQKLMSKLPSFAANEQDEKKSITFKRLILNQCQEEFEKDESKKQEERDKLATMSEDEKLEAEFTIKRRWLGMIRFIGELFARQILAAPIMLRCVGELLGDPEDPNEEQIESLCKLLGVVGKQLEQKNASFIADTFNKLENLTASPKLSSRIRFMIQDTQEMKERGWQARRQTEEAQKVSELRAEEEKKLAALDKEKKPAKKAAFGKGDRYFAAASAPNAAKKKTTVVSEDGEWTTTTTKSKGGKWKETRTTQDVRRAASPKRSTSSTSSRSTQEGKESAKDLAQRNAYAFLDEDAEDANEIEESSETPESPSASESTETPDEGFLNRIEKILREFWSTQDRAEVSLAAKELIDQVGGQSSLLSFLISHPLKISVGASTAQRQLAIEFILYLAEQNIINQSQLTQGLDRSMEKLADWALDLPVLGDELGSLLASLIHKQSLPLSYLSSSGLEHLYHTEDDTEDLSKLFRSVFRHLLQLSDASDKEAALLEQIKSLKLDLVKSMPSYDREEAAAFRFYCEDRHGVSALSSLFGR